MVQKIKLMSFFNAVKKHRSKLTTFSSNCYC